MNKYRIELKWALIFAIMTLLWAVIEKAAGFHDERIADRPVFGVFILVPATVIYYFALNEKKNKYYGGGITYRQGILSGILLSLFIGVISILTSIINLKIISPDFLSNTIHHAISSGSLTAEQASRQFNTPAFITTGAIAAVVTGAVISAVVSLFITRNRQKGLTT